RLRSSALSALVVDRSLLQVAIELRQQQRHQPERLALVLDELDLGAGPLVDVLLRGLGKIDERLQEVEHHERGLADWSALLIAVDDRVLGSPAPDDPERLAEIAGVLVGAPFDRRRVEQLASRVDALAVVFVPALRRCTDRARVEPGQVGEQPLVQLRVAHFVADDEHGRRPILELPADREAIDAIKHRLDQHLQRKAGLAHLRATAHEQQPTGPRTTALAHAVELRKAGADRPRAAAELKLKLALPVVADLLDRETPLAAGPVRSEEHTSE